MAPLVPSQLRPDVEGRFEAVYRTHVRDVYGFSLGMLGNTEDAEDVTQTTFLNAYRALKRGEDVRNLRAWLLAIAHNVCRQRFRTAARRPREVELDPEAAEAFVDEDAPTATEIRSAMRQLSFNQRTVLVLREIEGLSYEQIAQAMGISLSAVETLLFRARRALREQLEAAEHDLGCHAVERLISLQLDGKLSRQDRGLLRAHLRTCAECARLARSQRARKRIMPGLIAVPLPASLSGAFGTVTGGGGGLVTAKVAALAASVALVGAGALVQSGVVPTPGDESRAVAAQGAEASSPVFTAPVWAPSASLERVFAGRGGKAPAQPKPDKPTGQRQAPAGAGAAAGGTAAPATSGSGAVAASGTSSGGRVGWVTPPAPPAAPAAPDVVGTAQDNLPPLPGSLPNVAPSLPPVNVPVPDVPGPLP
jgi:RNA polymerase sigma factor (sigma-70 family)